MDGANMSGAEPGSIRGRKGGVSVWRVPNFLLEPRGDFFHEHDELIERLNKWRSVAGGSIVIGMIIYYAGLAHTGYTRKGGVLGGANMTTNTPEGSWIGGLIVTFSVAIFVVPIVSLVLVLTAERGHRLATLYQLRWIAIASVSYAGLCAVSFGIAEGVADLQKSSTKHLDPVLDIVLTLLGSAVGIILLVWFCKGFYLLVTGLFRADDAHPLLAPIAAIPIVWIASLVMYFEGGTGGLSGVPETLGKIVAFGGAVSVTIISVFTLRRLKNHPGWAFRRGPLPAHVKIGASKLPIRGDRHRASSGRGFAHYQGHERTRQVSRVPAETPGA